MKASGPKTRFPKMTKSPLPAQEDIEIEVAEVLYGLMTSKNQDPSQKFEKTMNIISMLIARVRFLLQL